MPEVTHRLAGFAMGLHYEDIPAPVLETAKKAFVDNLATILAGSREECGRIAAATARFSQAAPTSTVIGAGFKTSPSLAAFANGTAAHALDYDDSCISFHGHPSSSTVPPALALAEACGGTGRDLLAAYVAAFEVGHRIAQSVNMRHWNLRFHTTLTIGVFRAATASARLLGLDVEATRRALGMAASMSGGIHGNFGTMTKPLHAGLSGQNGIIAAQLAQQGFTANPDILEVKGGWCDAFCAGEGYNLESMVNDLGDPLCLEKPGVNFKLHPCCQGGIPIIDGVLAAKRKHSVAADQVDRIRVGVNYLRLTIMPYTRPQTTIEARFSMTYCAAVAMFDREVSLAAFTPERMADPALKEMIERVDVYVPEWMGNTLPQGAEVTLVLKDGTALFENVEVPWFEMATPVPWDALAAKFADCAAGTLSPSQVDRALDILAHLEDQPNVTELMSILASNADR